MQLEDDIKELASGLPQQSHPDRIKLFGWYLHSRKSVSTFQPSDIAKCYDALNIGRPSSFGGYFTNLIRSKELLKNGSGYRLESRIREVLDKKYGTRQRAIYVTALLEALPKQLPNLAERNYLDEALRCFRAQAFRASIVMCWNLAFDHLCQFILADTARLTAFNTQLPKSFPKADISSISQRDNFTELKEWQVLQISKSSNIISGGLHKVLKEKLDRRNIAAHASGVIIAPPTAEEFIKDLIENVVLKLV